jgi:hypothetical protein
LFRPVTPDPPRYAWLAYALVGATMAVIYTVSLGRTFKNVGLTVK